MRGNPDHRTAGEIDTDTLEKRLAWARESTRLALILELDEHVVTVRETPHGAGWTRTVLVARGTGVLETPRQWTTWIASAYWDGHKLFGRVGSLSSREWGLVEHGLVRAELAAKEEP